MVHTTKYKKYCELSVGLKLDKSIHANSQKASRIVLIAREENSTFNLYFIFITSRKMFKYPNVSCFKNVINY